MCLRQITETDESVHNDCTVCSVLMALGYGTCHRHQAGATEQGIFRQADGTQLDAAEMKQLREAVRVRTGDAKGGTSIETVLAGVGRTWPSLAYLDCQHLPMATIVTQWKAGRFGCIQGNPSGVKNTNSKLRRWTYNDNYGHAIGAGILDSSNYVRILDPMGPNSYSGDRVPLAEIQQFMKPLQRSDGTYHSLLFGKGTLLHALIDPATFQRYAGSRSFTVPKGTRKIGYRFNLQTGQTDLVRDDPLATYALNVQLVAEATIRQYPNAVVKPSGTYYQVDPKSGSVWAGLWISDAGGKLGPVPVAADATELDAIKKLAFANGVTFTKSAAATAISQIRPPG
jgi:hypothetical protein